MRSTSPRYCDNIQKIYTTPEMEKAWKTHNESTMALAVVYVHHPAIVLGMLSWVYRPGHNATFGTDIVLDNALCIICTIGQEIVQSHPG